MHLHFMTGNADHICSSFFSCPSTRSLQAARCLHMGALSARHQADIGAGPGLERPETSPEGREAVQDELVSVMRELSGIQVELEPLHPRLALRLAVVIDRLGWLEVEIDHWHPAQSAVNDIASDSSLEE